MELQNLKSFQSLKEQDAILAGQVESVYKLTYETINGISRFYDNYTMHDMNHGLRVASYMEELAFGIGDEFDAKIKQFNALEIALMILSALLHDIGMFIRPEDETAIKNNEIKYTNSLSFSGVLKVSKSESEAVKEIVRLTHAARIAEFLDCNINGQTISKILLVNGNYSYADDIALICTAHGEDYGYLKKLRTESTKGNYTYNQQYIAALLRIADYLDLDRQRTPILWYTMMGIEGFSREEWETHFIIQNEKKLRRYIDDKMQIYFDGKSSNAKIHRKYLSYIDKLKSELENADALLNTKDSNKKYTFNVSLKIDDCVQTDGFKYSDLRLNLDYSSITDLLMGKNIYGNKKLGLRELIQNAIDACKLMEEIKLTDPDILIPPAIYVILSQKNNFVKIKDTGIGMTLDVVKKHFLNVGKSYYKSNEFFYENHSYEPIGQYGIGFLSCFLLSDNVVVKTKYYKSHEISQIELEKHSEYVVTSTEETANFLGTEITLDYNDFFEVFGKEDELVSFLEKYFFTTIPIYVRNLDNNTNRPIENSCSKIINSNLAKDPTRNKYETVECAKYSNIVDGVLNIKLATKNKRTSVKTFDINRTYLYNPESKTFELLRDAKTSCTGYYTAIKYASIDYESYANIKKPKRSEERMRIAVLSLAEKMHQSLMLLINREEDLDIMSLFESQDQISINEERIEDVLKRSNLAYFEELLNDYRYFDRVFVEKYQYVYLHGCSFYSYWNTYSYIDDAERYDFFFYNKDILVNQAGRIVCQLPYMLDATGYLNYKGNNIKLNVSRNSIVSGHLHLQAEITSILLQYLKESENDCELQAIIEKILEFQCSQDDFN